MSFWFCSNVFWAVKGVVVEWCNDGLTCVQSFPRYSRDVDSCGLVYLGPDLWEEILFPCRDRKGQWLLIVVDLKRCDGGSCCVGFGLVLCEVLKVIREGIMALGVFLIILVWHSSEGRIVAEHLILPGKRTRGAKAVAYLGSLRVMSFLPVLNLPVLGRASHPRLSPRRLMPAPGGFRQTCSHLSGHLFSSFFFFLVIVLVLVLQLNLYLREVWGEGGKEECESGCFQGSQATFFSLRYLFLQHCWN